MIENITPRVEAHKAHLNSHGNLDLQQEDATKMDLVYCLFELVTQIDNTVDLL